MKSARIQPLRLLRRWLDHDWTSRFYFLMAFGYLFSAYWRHRIKSIAAILADLERSPPPAIRDASFDWRKAAWAIEAAAAYAPWRSDCLIRAMAATTWLRQHGYRPVFHLGVAPVEGRADLKAHAWLSLHDEVIVGGDDEDTGVFAPLLGSRIPKA